IGIRLPDGRETSYRYDAFGRRIAKTVDGHTTTFFWQGDQLVAESSPSHHRSYVYEPDSFRPLALLDGHGPQQVRAFHYQLDHLGTPQELTSHEGEIVWSARYDAYGKLSQLSHGGNQPIDQPLRFQGQYFDAESGLHYNRHRYYQPDSGRYLTPDPVKLAGGLNAYRYTPNPTGWVDPLGLVECPGGGGCKKPVGGERDPAGKVKVDEGEAKLPSPPKKETYLYRGDSIHPDEVFRTGFLSKGESTDLLLHAMDSDDPPSNFVSTSPSKLTAIKFGTRFNTRKGYLYTLKKIDGVDVNKELKNLAPFADETEIAIPRKIETRDILGVTPLKKDGSYVGYSLPNPNRE
ncbi:RHS repeat-associated core domain-containing protein, partial [Pseudomonas sp. NPDC089569]|uniref:RHS repeat domain-containing protein n=1 Tax=Pseudomonas sp. NPDC089569 TaxID=3390722 RepID=UPI003D0844CB